MREAVTFKNVSQPSDYGDAGTAEASSSALEPLNKRVSSSACVITKVAVNHFSLARSYRRRFYNSFPQTLT
jgi:hypothetical protein